MKLESCFSLPQENKPSGKNPEVREGMNLVKREPLNKFEATKDEKYYEAVTCDGEKNVKCEGTMTLLDTSPVAAVSSARSHDTQEHVRNFVLSRLRSNETEESQDSEDRSTINHDVSGRTLIKLETNNNEHQFVSPQRSEDTGAPSGDGFHELHQHTNVAVSMNAPSGEESVIMMRMSHRCHCDSLLGRHLCHHHCRGASQHIPPAHAVRRHHNGFVDYTLSPVVNGYTYDDVAIPWKKVRYTDMVAGGNCVDMTVMSLSVSAKGSTRYEAEENCDKDSLFARVSEL